MSEIKKINVFFGAMLKEEYENMLDKLLLTDDQEKIMYMRYIKHNDICFIADSMSLSKDTVNNELKKIRVKINKII